jgi:hypothetical protein
VIDVCLSVGNPPIVKNAKPFSTESLKLRTKLPLASTAN